jgi:thiol-disulfide isomerase/thioredoxin
VTEVPNQAKPRSALPFLLAFIAGVIGVYWYNDGPRKADTPDSPVTEEAPEVKGPFSKAYATGSVAGVIVHGTRKALPAFTFTDQTGAPAMLSQWQGRVILLNVWATWCAPCRKEMPDLSALQTALGSKDFEVVTLSADAKGATVSADFLRGLGITNLAVFADPELKSLAQLQLIGLPGTLLIDRQGREAARILGPAKWDAPEAMAMIKALTAE